MKLENYMTREKQGTTNQHHHHKNDDRPTVDKSNQAPMFLIQVSYYFRGPGLKLKA